MTRFRLRHSKSDLADSQSPLRPSTQDTRFLSSADHEHRILSSILNRWPSKPTSFPRQRANPVVSRPHVGVGHEDILQYSNTAARSSAPTTSPSARSVASLPRLPRHVPIMIPDFAQPYAPKASTTGNKLSVSISVPHLDGFVDHVDPSHVKADQKISLDDHVEPDLRYRTSGARSDMNDSQVSLSTSESGADQPLSALPPTRSPTRPVNDGNPQVSRSGSAGGGANLSGLVCNVHKTTGREAPPLVGATTTIIGDKLFVFGGRVHSRSRPQMTSDLYELDLIRRHWTRVDTYGDIPPPRYFHSVCALGDTKLVCYGGMSPAPHLREQAAGQPDSADTQPEVVVMSDIHIYDIPTRKWHLVVPSTVGIDAPQGRYAHCATILPSSAVFISASAPHSAIHHNRPTSDPHSGTLGVQLDGAGGAEMLVVGGQDSANNYIEQISVFNLRSLKWTSITDYDRKCGAYKSMVAPLAGLNAEDMGRGLPLDDPSKPQAGTSMLIYSNYNFLDVKLELQVRLPDGTIIEREMAKGESPPGLRFPNGGILNNHFVVSGTYLTSSKHEYALWALDLRTLAWRRIDTAGSVFSSGSWNRGILWTRRNQFVILGHRKRNLVDDYNHRRINFAHVCMVELEAFGLYENPRKSAPTSSYISNSAPPSAASHQTSMPASNAGGRQLSAMAEQLGQAALTLNACSDMELVALGGERLSCNSQILAKRWGPYFNQLLLDAFNSADNKSLSDATTLRATMNSQASRASTITITPGGANGLGPLGGTNFPDAPRSISQATTRTLMDAPNGSIVPASSRPRALYLPHMVSTLRLLLHYLYTSSLPPLSSPLCTPHTLCSLLQIARPYQLDGLLEATTQRLHEVLDGRNAAAVFNAAAMAAGGGSSTRVSPGSMTAELERRDSEYSNAIDDSTRSYPGGMLPGSTKGSLSERKNSQVIETDASSTASPSQTDAGSSTQGSSTLSRDRDRAAPAWAGSISSVIGLQKRGLRGLMDGRRLREKSAAANSAGEV